MKQTKKRARPSPAAHRKRGARALSALLFFSLFPWGLCACSQKTVLASDVVSALCEVEKNLPDGELFVFYGSSAAKKGVLKEARIEPAEPAKSATGIEGEPPQTDGSRTATDGEKTAASQEKTAETRSKAAVLTENTAQRVEKRAEEEAAEQAGATLLDAGELAALFGLDFLPSALSESVDAAFFLSYRSPVSFSVIHCASKSDADEAAGLCFSRIEQLKLYFGEPSGATVTQESPQTDAEILLSTASVTVSGRWVLLAVCNNVDEAKRAFRRAV